jgi:transglutaminase-like putative cysteine protease
VTPRVRVPVVADTGFARRRAVGPPDHRPPAREVSPGRSAELRTSGALLAALLITIAGLHVILQGVAWWYQLAMLCVLLLGTAALVRRLGGGRPGAGGSGLRRRLLPPLAAAAGLVLALTALFVPATAFLRIIPTAASGDAFQRLAEAANSSIERQSIPAVATTPIMFLLCLGVGALVIVADVLANALRTPALAGIPLLVLLGVPSAITIDATDPIVFVLAALSYLLLLRANAPRRQTRQTRQTRLTLGLAAIVVGGALLAPLVLPAVEPAQNGTGSGFGSGVNPVLSLGANLRQDVEHTVLDYSTKSGSPQYLRLVSISNFSGSDWAPDAFRLRTRNTPEAIEAPPGLSGDVATTHDTTYVTVQGLSSPWLPLPYPTSSVSGLQGAWYWDSDGLAVKSPTGTARDENYEATSLTIQPTPAQLAAAGTTVPAGVDRFLALPASMPKVISDTAFQVAGGGSSNYEKALLLQGFFRDGDFEYSETAPVQKNYDGTGMKVIAAFLAAKAGYCIHFASAMAVMARSLGIPSRIAVGFLPGTEQPGTVDGRTAFTVTSHNLHAWPELYFDGIGWTRFEPTVGRGDVPAYADAASPDVPVPVNTATATPNSSATPRASAPSAPRPYDRANQPGSSGSRFSPIGPVVVLILALAAIGGVLLAPAVFRESVRRRRMRDLRSGSAPALTGWREAIQTAEDLGIPVPDTATAREAADLFASASGSASREAIDRLRVAVERESYSAAGLADTLPADARVADTRFADTASIVADLRGAVGRWRRLRAALVPPSVWRRVRRALGSEPSSQPRASR